MSLMTRVTPGTDERMPGPPGGGGQAGAEGRWTAMTGTRPGPGPGTQRRRMRRVWVSEQSRTEAAASVIDLIDLK